MGFGLKDDGPPPGLSWLEEEEADAAPPESEQLLAGLEFEKSIAEMERWRDEAPPALPDFPGF